MSELGGFAIVAIFCFLFWLAAQFSIKNSKRGLEIANRAIDLNLSSFLEDQTGVGPWHEMGYYDRMLTIDEKCVSCTKDTIFVCNNNPRKEEIYIDVHYKEGNIRIIFGNKVLFTGDPLNLMSYQPKARPISEIASSSIAARNTPHQLEKIESDTFHHKEDTGVLERPGGPDKEQLDAVGSGYTIFIPNISVQSRGYYGKNRSIPTEVEVLLLALEYDTKALRFGDYPPTGLCAGIKLFNNSTKRFCNGAELGDDEAQYELGVSYREGTRGVPQDYTLASMWFRRAADQNHRNAQFDLGVNHVNGQGVAKDFDLALGWFNKAASLGHTSAQFTLGACYYTGRGVSQDYTLAVDWFRKAAEQNFNNAQFNLGVCYDLGHGVEKDHARASDWFRRVKEEDLDRQQLAHELFNSTEQDNLIDEKKTFQWYTNAVKQNDKEAQYNLGTLYFNACALCHDYTEPYYWLSLAAAGESANDKATKARDAIGTRMSADDIRRVQRRSSDWFDRHPR